MSYCPVLLSCLTVLSYWPILLSCPTVLSSHSDNPFWWAILMGYSVGPFWWAILMGHYDGPFWWTILMGHSDGPFWLANPAAYNGHSYAPFWLAVLRSCLVQQTCSRIMSHCPVILYFYITFWVCPARLTYSRISLTSFILRGWMWSEKFECCSCRLIFNSKETLTFRSKNNPFCPSSKSEFLHCCCLQRK